MAANDRRSLQGRAIPTDETTPVFYLDKFSDNEYLATLWMAAHCADADPQKVALYREEIAGLTGRQVEAKIEDGVGQLMARLCDNEPPGGRVTRLYIGGKNGTTGEPVFCTRGIIVSRAPLASEQPKEVQEQLFGEDFSR
jgi:hypothetical protein